MQKRTAGEYLVEMEKRISGLRRRGLRSMRKKILPENLRESHAREFAVRSWVVPSFRSTLGSGLNAIILPGSVQLGVRKASAKRPKSDIDVSVVVSCDKDCIQRGVKLAAGVESKIKELMGVDVNIHVFPADVFLHHQLFNLHLIYSPFQVLYGKRWVKETFGKDFGKDFRILRELIKDKQKYKMLSVKK